MVEMVESGKLEVVGRDGGENGVDESLNTWKCSYYPAPALGFPIHVALYLKTGPGNLEKDVERRFSYALSREDIENAVLGGP